MPADNAAAAEASRTPADEMAQFQGVAMQDGEPIAPARQPRSPAPKAQAAEDQDDGGDEEVDDNDERADEAPKPKASAQERINKAVGKQRQAERDLATERQARLALEARLDALEKGLTPAKAAATTEATDQAPDPADPKYKFGEMDSRYLADVARYEAKQAIKAEREAEKATQTTAAQTTAQAELNARIERVEQLGAEKYDDFDEVVTQPAKARQWPLSRPLGELIMDPEGEAFAADILYMLGSDVKLAKELYGKSPAAQARWYGKQVAKLEIDTPPEAEGDELEEAPRPKAPAPASRNLSKAPAPTRFQSRGNGNGKGFDPATPDFAAFEAKAAADSLKPRR